MNELSFGTRIAELRNISNITQLELNGWKIVDMKLSGDGEGAYMGAILVDSYLSKEELKEYLNKKYFNVEEKSDIL